MHTEQNLLDELRQLAQQWRASTHSRGAPSPELQQRFDQSLTELYATGWDYALGWANELPDEYLPEHYVRRRAQILDQLEDELGPLAIEFRRSETRSADQLRAIERYRQVMNEMFRIGHWHGEPDIEAQLPDELMPPSFHEFRQRRVEQ